MEEGYGVGVYCMGRLQVSGSMFLVAQKGFISMLELLRATFFTPQTRNLKPGTCNQNQKTFNQVADRSFWNKV